MQRVEVSISQIALFNKSSTCDQKLTQVKVNYTVKNLGFEMKEAKVWSDEVSLLCGDQQIYGKAFRIVNIVKSGQVYTNEVIFQFENFYETDLNLCSIQVMANSNGGVYEIFSKENNKMSSCCYVIKKKPSADFRVNMADPSSKIINLNSSQLVKTSYYYTNVGDGSTKTKQAWTDGFYLYNTTSIDFKSLIQNGILIGLKAMFYTFGVECKSNSSLVSLTSFIPSNLESVWFGFMLHDIEALANSNQKAISQYSFNITKPVPSDLKVLVNSLNSSNSFFNLSAGTILRFKFDVVNVGLAKAKGKIYNLNFTI